MFEISDMTQGPVTCDNDLHFRLAKSSVMFLNFIADMLLKSQIRKVYRTGASYLFSWKNKYLSLNVLDCHRTTEK